MTHTLLASAVRGFWPRYVFLIMPHRINVEVRPKTAFWKKHAVGAIKVR